MNIAASLIIGLIFGFGLILSGMADPAKVLNFLDLAGNWDPSLAFVMGGAVMVAAIGYRLTLRRSKPVLEDRFHLSERSKIDSPLIVGAAIFGAGWGLAGFCPGPAIVSLALGAHGTLVFVIAMLVGMFAVAWLRKSRGAPDAVGDTQV